MSPPLEEAHQGPFQAMNGIRTFCAIVLFASIASHAGDEAEVEIEGPIADARIDVHKDGRELLLFTGDKLIRRFRVGLGPRPLGDKHREGDGATPEGEYFLCVKNPKSRYYLSLGLNYPNGADAARGREAGLLAGPEYEAIVAADRDGRRPPWDTKLGGEIYIHGHGAGTDWTRGCIALEDHDMKELYLAVSIGTPVRILP